MSNLEKKKQEKTKLGCFKNWGILNKFQELSGKQTRFPTDSDEIENKYT